MAVDDWVKIAQTMTTLIQAIAWPLVLLLALISFRDPLRTFISNLSEFSLTAGGVDISAKRQMIEAAANLAAASTKGGTALASQTDIIADIVDVAGNPRTMRKLRGSHVLWVDDKPDNNVYERRSLEALGVKFDLSTSSDDALQKMKHREYDTIISDMGRPDDPQAGLTLVSRLKQMQNATPFIIYSASTSPELRNSAKRAGACGQTNNPQELFELVIRAIQYGC